MPELRRKDLPCPLGRTSWTIDELFEAFAIRVLQAAGTTEQARILLGLTWNSVQRIMDRAVERGLIVRDLEEIKHVGIDEKNFRRGHDYISVLTDIDHSRVL